MQDCSGMIEPKRMNTVGVGRRMPEAPDAREFTFSFRGWRCLPRACPLFRSGWCNVTTASHYIRILCIIPTKVALLYCAHRPGFLLKAFFPLQPHTPRLRSTRTAAFQLRVDGRLHVSHPRLAFALPRPTPCSIHPQHCHLDSSSTVSHTRTGTPILLPH